MAIIQDEQTPTALYNAALQALKKKDYKAAETLLRQVLALNSRYQESSGRSVWHRLGLTLERQEKYTEALHVLKQGRDSLQTADLNDWYLDYDLARLYAEHHVEGKENEITELVYGVFKNSHPEHQPDLWQRFYHEIAFLLKEPKPADVKKEFSQSGGNPGLRLLRFFRREDPYPTTPANEALPIFFQRSAEARKRFGDPFSPRGYDDRGDIYVRYGRPWRVHPDHSGTMGDVGWAIYPNEVWFYNPIHPDLYFTFILKEGRQHYTLADGPESVLGSFYRGRRTFFNRENAGETVMLLRDQIYRDLAPSHENFRRRLYEISNLLTASETATRSHRIDYSEAANYSALHFTNEDKKHAAHVDSIAPAVVFDEDYKAKSLPMALSFSRFQDDPGKTRAEIYYGGLYRDLKFKRVGKENQANLRGEIAILNEEYELVAADSIQESCLLPDSAPTDSGEFVSQANFLLQPAKYHLFFRLKNPEGGQVGSLRYDLETISFPEKSLSLSDIQLSTEIREARGESRFVKNGYFVMPLPNLMVNKAKPIFVYFEVYNLSVDRAGETNYQVDYRVSVPERGRGFFKKLFSVFGAAGGKKHSVTLSTSRQGRSPTQVEHVQLDLGEFRSSDLELEVVVTDLQNKHRAWSKLPFKLVE
ncbi:MAG: GWxTD domain-containing protein [candidate division KSB1 bacterium]|nr:GWxTD domain-containing protein [candidate division KSB1 bacterium]MDZ7301258.1 GWxTD domain-containing protein [candidate division KSB1 bacterium]MDZ7310518.1 GWxTD domain-containing protein [candidate division KSB1 bacterium]